MILCKMSETVRISESEQGASGYSSTPCDSKSANSEKHSKQTRHSSMVFGLGHAITDEDSEIHGAR